MSGSILVVGELTINHASYPLTDDIIASIREHVPGPFTTNIDHFAKRLVEDEKFRPLGDKLNQMIHTKRQENEPHDERVSIFELFCMNAACLQALQVTP